MGEKLGTNIFSQLHLFFPVVIFCHFSKNNRAASPPESEINFSMRIESIAAGAFVTWPFQRLDVNGGCMYVVNQDGTCTVVQYITCITRIKFGGTARSSPLLRDLRPRIPPEYLGAVCRTSAGNKSMFAQSANSWIFCGGSARQTCSFVHV